MPARRPSLRELVRQSVLEKIGSGALNPGERVVEAALAAELGVSSIPVREAIRELVAMGILEFAPHRGAWVRKVSLQETIDTLRIRAALEPLAADTAVPRLAGRCTALRAAVEEIVKAACRRDLAGFQLHNQHFHRAVVQAAGSEVLLRAWDSMAYQVRTRFTLQYLTAVDPVMLAKEHEEIVDAIDEGDVKRTATLLRSHSSGLVRYLKQQEVAERKEAGQNRRNSSVTPQP
jgi:DNA-binding GntR family transcriptional regulator